MARIERTSSEQPFDVEQAQLIDPSGFRFSDIGAEAIQQIGGTLFELGKRDLAAKNSLAVNATSESRRLAKLKMEEFIKNNPDPDTWGEGARNIIEEQAKIYSQQRFNKETGAQQEIEQEAFEDGLNMEVGIATVAQNIENDIAVSGKNVIDVISTDDGTPDAADEIEKQIKMYQEALERKYAKDVAAVRMEETLKEAKKAFYIDQSKLDPDAIIKQMEKKKKALGKAGKDKEGLGAKDYDDIIASAYTAKVLADKSLDTLQEADRDELGQSLQDGTIDYSMINSTSLDEKEQESYRVKMNAEAERKAKGIPLEINRSIEAELEGMAYDISSGAVTMPEFKKRLEEAYVNDDIDGALRSTLNSLAERKFESYQAGAMKEREVFALGQLVTFPSELGFAERLAQLTSQFEKEQAQTLRQLQFDNLDQYKKALRDWLKKNKDADADEIYKEGRSLLTHYRKTPDQLRSPITAGEAAVTAIKEIAAQADIARALAPKVLKGPLNNPKFVITDGNPEMEYDAEGKEIGLKLENGNILKIGNQYRIGNVTWEYLGNGRAKKIK